MTIADNLHVVQQRIAEACTKANRNPAEVQLLAASKRTDAQGVMEAIRLGHLLFGENQAQSLRDKYDIVAPHYPEATWHFIGHLQKNKVKYIVGRASMVHSVDSIELAGVLSERIAGQRAQGIDLADIQVLVQVKLGEEESKSGVDVSDLWKVCAYVVEAEGLSLTGLMNIAPLYGEARQWFTEMAELREKGRNKGFNLQELSMGMSGDLEEAVACGATIVRIGSDIFSV